MTHRIANKGIMELSVGKETKMKKIKKKVHDRRGMREGE